MKTDTNQDFKINLDTILSRIEAACQRAGRSSDDVTLIAVTKRFGPDEVRLAWESGIHILGENRVQEAAAKIPQSISGPDWHLIGHLQGNKVRQALGLFSCIHSVDSLKLLRQIERIAAEEGATPEVLLEVNVSGESSKFGFKPEDVPEALKETMEMRYVTLSGLMTMAPIVPDPELARPVFVRLRECRDKWADEFGIVLPHLSMGMSGDFEVAIEEGATMVRLGTSLFGGRPRWRPSPGSEDTEERTWVVD